MTTNRNDSKKTTITLVFQHTKIGGFADFVIAKNWDFAAFFFGHGTYRKRGPDGYRNLPPDGRCFIFIASREIKRKLCLKNCKKIEIQNIDTFQSRFPKKIRPAKGVRTSSRLRQNRLKSVSKNATFRLSFSVFSAISVVYKSFRCFWI